MADIKINAITGMNNISSSFFKDDGVASPRVVRNADITVDGKATKRDGTQVFLALPGAHSLWACDLCMLCSAYGRLYDISTGEAVDVGGVSGVQTEKLDYVLIEGLVYISNKYWNRVYHPATQVLSDWGILPPSGPILSAGAGGLQPGTYHVTLTTIDQGKISGNGPISSITLDAVGGIGIYSRPANTLVWATDQDGYVFTLVGDVDSIVEIPTVEPLPSFMCSPPPPLTCITYAFGRVWGVDGDTLLYSEPYQPGYFKPISNRFKFNSPITLVAHISTGIFVGMKDRTIFLAGTEPEKMSQVLAGAGSVKGTLAYCDNLPELGDVLGTPEKGYTDVPVWRTVDGIVAGNVSGRLFNLTKNKINMNAADVGASLYRQTSGGFQFLTSSKVSDTVSCDQWRNGVLL